MAAIKRPLNAEDRAYLNERAAVKNDFGLWGALGTVFMLTIMGTFWLMVLIGVLYLILRALPIASHYADMLRAVNPGFVFGFMASLATLVESWMWVKWKRDTRRVLAGVEREIAENEVEEDQLTVEAVKCFQEPEHFGKIYLLKLTDGRIRVRYDYDSVDTEGRGKSPRTNFPISREMRMVHFRHLCEHRYSFGPSKIRKPRAKPINLSPDHWPEDETWLDLPWDDVDGIYASSH